MRESESTPVPSPERWRTLEPLLDAALELPAARRREFLDDACAGDPLLRSELEAMLAECDAGDHRLDEPAAQRFASLLDESYELAELRAELAPNYAVVRELGRGGMGTVYLARDLRHEREVAVKVLAPGLAGGANGARFLEEIRLTARLRHPHILPLFDSGVAAGRPWYVTPYVEGGTLRDRLLREGRLPLADTLRILRELAAALAYAHESGVMHRDVKPENILLDASGAVLGDFGIARALERATSSAAPSDGIPTIPGLGTPVYMAPERGAPGMAADHRVDLYALGVIAHEMLHGFQPPTVDPAAELPAELGRIISRLLARHPEARIQSAEELLRALDELRRELDGVALSVDLRTMGSGSRSGMESSQVSRSGVDGSGAPRRRGLSLTLVLLVILAFAGAAGWAFRSWRAGDPSSPRRVLVIPFENATGDPSLAALGRMAADWVAQGLAETGAVDVASEIIPTASGGDRELRELARRAGAGTLVSGAYYLDGDSVRLQARVTDVADWTLLRPVAPVTAARAAPHTLVEPLRQRVMAVLALTHDPRSERWVMGSSPPTFEAYEQLVAGLDLFAAGNWAAAIPIWERAAALDSNFVQPLLHAVFGYMNLNRWAEADSLSRLLTWREVLTPFDRAMLDFQRAEIAGDYVAVLAAAEGMLRAAPGADLPYFLKASAALRANRPRAAVEALTVISSRMGRFGTAWASSNNWRVLTASLHALGEHEEELRAAHDARERRPGIREIVWYELRALAALGDGREVEARVAQLEGLQVTPGGRSIPNLLIELADELEAHGHPDPARAILLRADRWQRSREGDGDGAFDARYDRALVLSRLGDDAAADSSFALLELEQPMNAMVLGERGLLALHQGRAADAQRIAERLRTLRTPYDHGRAPFTRAQLAAQAGDLEGALALLRLALAEGLPFGMHLHTAPALAPLRDEPEFQELLRPRG